MATCLARRVSWIFARYEGIVKAPSMRTTHPLPAFNWIFSVLFVFYWMVQFARGDIISALPNELAYYFNVIPAILFALGGILYISLQNLPFDKITVPLIIYMAATVSIAVWRGDFPSAATAGLMATTLIVLFLTKPVVSTTLLNSLFFLSGLITTGLFFADLTIYTVFPGLNSHPEIWWRASPLPTASNGGFFAMFVFLMNLVHRSIPARHFFLALAIFFIVVSGNRTALAGTVICLAYYLGARHGLLSTALSRAIFTIFAFSLFIGSIYASQLIATVFSVDNPFLRVLFFRQEHITFDVEGNATSAGIRTWIINQNLGLFLENPLTGIGTFDLRALQSGYGALDDLTTGSEAYLSYLLARYGVAALVLIYVLLFAKRPLAGDAKLLSTLTRLGLLTALITYGSFANPYDFIFLMMLMGITGGIVAPPGPSKKRPRPPTSARAQSASPS